jgi:uncharacterized membrane protein YraQ (UPF0718 family)
LKGALMGNLDWVSITSIVMAIAAIIGLVIQWYKKEKPWEEITSELKMQVSKIQQKQEHTDDIYKALREALEEKDDRHQKSFEKVESKLEKLTDLVIQILQKK